MRTILNFDFKKLNLRSDRSGFTLVELMVTISLIVIFVATAVSYNRSIGQQISLFKDQGILVNEIYTARSLAIDTYGRPSGSTTDACGYGIHIESENAITLFKDLPGLNGACGPYLPQMPIYKSGIGEEVETVNLSGANVITIGSGTPITETPVDILFVPPDPQVFSNRSFNIDLTITSTATNDSFNIIINQFGQISIQ